ncbi:MAG: right-handed parallel beta-helix repeat-containing protein [Alteromonadaceae bacterium]|nr:right-handed parallel beta-helix repeat-containing protein [Alteromonadaceae bacterium]
MRHLSEGKLFQSLKILVALLLSAFVIACATNNTSIQQVEYRSTQDINNLIRDNTELTGMEHGIEMLVKEGKLDNPLLTRNLVETARLLYLGKKTSIKDAVTLLANEQPERAATFIEIALILFSDYQVELIDSLFLDGELDENELISAVISVGMEPSRWLPATASLGDNIKVVPLINSASITIYNREDSQQAKLRFKEANSDDWQEGLPLYWEPVFGALSGSIVHLQSDTKYNVHVEIVEDGSLVEEFDYEFTTRPNSPPINPNLVFRLSDIYSGGQLNLEELNISGEADGWAKIIGDENTPVIANENDDYAINIGNSRYVMLEGVTVKGGKRHGIYSRNTHHIWIKNCDVSGWGRTPTHFKNGIGFENKESYYPINYDAGIALSRTGIVVVEGCKVHSPNGTANHWGYGHPKGPTAMLILAKLYNPQFRGQYIIRNNRFFGSNEHRFNDVIESRINGRITGGFIRDSAIHDNYFGYANDDGIELDGGQSNVLFYNNEIEQAFCGVSAVPNMLGPSYIFNNYIHNLGDERDKNWAAIKLGGLYTRPAGIVNVFNNLVVTGSNGLAQGGFSGDGTFWTHAQNNIFVHDRYSQKKGYSIHDPGRFSGSKFINNFMFNTKAGYPVYNADISEEPVLRTDNSDIVEKFLKTKGYYKVPLPAEHQLKNFTVVDESGNAVVGIISRSSDANSRLNDIKAI